MSLNLAGLFFALDLIGYISTSWFLGRYSRDEKDLKFIIWTSSFIAVFGLFFMGTIHICGVPDSLIPFVIGTMIDGVAGALALNNGITTTVEHLREKFPGYGESINKTTSSIFMFYFSCGEMLGPILGSLLTAWTGTFTRGIAIIDAAMFLWCAFTCYHLGGYVIFKVARPVFPDTDDDEYISMDES